MLNLPDYISNEISDGPELARAYIAQRIVVEDRGFTSPCWIWQKCLTEKGYGRARIPGFPGRMMRVHRVAYELHIGPISDELQIDHLCRNKACCNPDHLEAVTNAENQRRQRGLYRKEFCQRGHRLTDDNRMVAKRNGAVRVTGCRICHNAYMREWSQRRNARTADNNGGGGGQGRRSSVIQHSASPQSHFRTDAL